MDVSRICSDLVSIRSENPPGRTDEVIEYIRELLGTWGINCRILTNTRGECNLVTTGTGTGLLLCGHVDVVPAMEDGWNRPPFSGAIEDGWVWGRGSTDMKGGCASLLGACSAFVDGDIPLPATLAFVCDEETGGDMGICRLLSEGLIHPCDCLIAEPSPAGSPSIGQKGLCRMEIEFSGEPAHGSLYPAVGRSAIMEAMDFMTFVRTLNEKEYPVGGDYETIIRRSSLILSQEFALPGVESVLRKITYNPGIIEGGEKSNVVAQHCRLDLELRIPWGCDISGVVTDLRRHAGHGTIRSLVTHEPSITDPGSRIVSRTCSAVQAVLGLDAAPIVQWAASDARHLRNAGFPVVEYGPGEISTLHAVNERVRTRALEKATEIYRRLMEGYVSKGTGKK